MTRGVEIVTSDLSKIFVSQYCHDDTDDETKSTNRTEYRQKRPDEQASATVGRLHASFARGGGQPSFVLVTKMLQLSHAAIFADRVKRSVFGPAVRTLD